MSIQELYTELCTTTDSSINKNNIAVIYFVIAYKLSNVLKKKIPDKSQFLILLTNVTQPLEYYWLQTCDKFITIIKT